jgi:hypothetical protein
VPVPQQHRQTYLIFIRSKEGRFAPGSDAFF